MPRSAYGEMIGTQEELDFLEDLKRALRRDDSLEDEPRCRDFDEAGLLTSNVGMTVRFNDGREFQVTVVQSGGKRTEGDEDEGD